MKLPHGTAQRPLYWVMEQHYTSFDAARDEARALADHRQHPVAVRATWSDGDFSGNVQRVRVACMVEPTDVVLDRLKLRRLK